MFCSLRIRFYQSKPVVVTPSVLLPPKVEAPPEAQSTVCDSIWMISAQGGR